MVSVATLRTFEIELSVSLTLWSEAKGKHGFDFDHSVVFGKNVIWSFIGLVRGPLPQGVRIRIKK